VTNTGQTLIELRTCLTRLQQIRPLDPSLAERVAGGEDPVAPGEREVQWPELARREASWKPKEAEIEPGEEETLDCDFVVSGSVEVVEVYSYIQNYAKAGRPIGWSRTSIVPLDGEGAKVMPQLPKPDWEKKQAPPKAPVRPTPQPQLPPETTRPPAQLPPKE
jgi:hypothetical protein